MKEKKFLFRRIELNSQQITTDSGHFYQDVPRRVYIVELTKKRPICTRTRCGRRERCQNSIRKHANILHIKYRIKKETDTFVDCALRHFLILAEYYRA